LEGHPEGTRARQEIYFLSGGLEAPQRFQTTRKIFFGGGFAAPAPPPNHNVRKNLVLVSKKLRSNLRSFLL